MNVNLVRTREPLWLSFKVPDDIKTEIEDTIENFKKERDASSTLAGHLEQQWYIDGTPKLTELMETLPSVYMEHSEVRGSSFAEDVYLENNIPFRFKSYWINYSKKGDFQPIHNHSGAFSFVIWVKIPYNIEEELSLYNSNDNRAGTFRFSYLDPRGRLISEKVDAVEWEGVFFPSWLMHTVYPFKTTDDYRISLSGNVFLDPQDLLMKDIKYKWH